MKCNKKQGGLIRSVSNSLHITVEGKAMMAAALYAFHDADMIRVMNDLQRLQDQDWITIQSWENEYDGKEAFCSDSFYVEHGHVYRLKTSFYTYFQDVVENKELISDLQYY